MDLIHYLYGNAIKRPRIKTLITMKLTFLLVIVFSLNGYTKGFSQITIHADNTSLEKIFDQVEKQSGYSFFYKVSSVKKTSISVDLKDAGIEHALSAILKNQPFVYSIVDKTVVIKAKPKNNDTDETAQNQQITVTGKVVDENNDPLERVTIKEKGGSNLTISKTDGSFTLTLKGKGALTFSMIGYQSKEINIANKTNLIVQLNRAVHEIDEVVVVGWYTEEGKSNRSNRYHIRRRYSQTTGHAYIRRIAGACSRPNHYPTIWPTRSRWWSHAYPRCWHTERKRPQRS